ncbi:MAG: zinc ABC transporter substrate-binding protein [Myxococcota bacterium]
MRVAKLRPSEHAARGAAEGYQNLRRAYLVGGVLAALLWSADSQGAERPRVGVTLHPYFSWLSTIAGDTVEVVPVLPAGIDPHTYQPRPRELEILGTLDALVLDGHGHDAYIEAMLKAAGTPKLRRIRPARGVPGLSRHRHTHGAEAHAHPDPHAYLSVSGAVQQIHNLARSLGKLYPEHADRYRGEARRYVRRLREVKAEGLRALGELEISGLRMATFHDGYGYLFQELGLDVTAVVQPRHGADPSAREVATTIERLRRQEVFALFVEKDAQGPLLDLVREGAGVRVYELSHVAKGDYSRGKFLDEMGENLASILAAARDYVDAQR